MKAAVQASIRKRFKVYQSVGAESTVGLAEAGAGNDASSASIRAREEAQVTQSEGESSNNQHCRRIRADEGSIATVYAQVRKTIAPLLEHKVSRTSQSHA